MPDTPKPLDTLPTSGLPLQNHGTGLKRGQQGAAAASSAPETPESEYALGGEWSTAPSLTDQLQRFPMHTRAGPMQMAVFTLPGDLEKLNALLYREHPAEAPGIRVDHLREEPMTDGCWNVLVRYRVMWYRKMHDLRKHQQ